MTRNLTYLIGIILTIVLGTFLYFTLCSDCRLAATSSDEVLSESEEIETPKTPEPTAFPFTVNGADFSLTAQENFNFTFSDADFLTPLSTMVTMATDSLGSYLKDNADKGITITGLYTSKETNNSAWPNLGIARANSVKNYLVQLGVPSSQTQITGKLMDNLIPKDSTFLGPISFDLGDKKVESKEQLADLYKKITDNPLILHFKTGEASIDLSTEQRQKIADIAHYLDQVPEAQCVVTGHTDNTGNRINNITLGQERADFAMAYFIRNGIPSAKITSNSKGPDAPIATNATEEGRSQNRRTVVTLK